jgi:acyl-CoA carboxylase epsilon subunit
VSEPPELRVVNPDATEEEVAAITAVIAAMSSGTTTAPAKSAHTWAAHSRTLRQTLRRGPGAWRASGLPH